MMKLRIIKSSLRTILITLCYIVTIVATMFSGTATRYAMYAFIISVAVVMSLFEKGGAKIYKTLPFLWGYIVIVIIITIIAQIMEGEIKPGAIIQPLFLLASFKLGYSIATQDGEKGCYYVLMQFSYIIAFAAVVSVPEWFIKHSLFYPNYGHAWEAFRVPSIYGHPIRLGTSLTIGLAIYFYLYKKNWQRYILIVLSVFGIYVCSSRSSWLACAGTVVLVVFAVYRKKITHKKFVYGIAIVMLFVIFLCSKPGQAIISSIYQRFEEGTGDNVSRVQRLGAIAYIWNDVVVNFNPLKFLFGHGEDAAANLMLKTTIVFNQFSTTDNQYALIAYNYGFIFLMVVLVGVFKCIRQLILKYNTTSNLMKCLYFICISQAICSFFYEVTENKVCSFVVVICIGMMIGRWHMTKRHYLQNKNA